jgi:nitrate reductase gamma subunit
LVLLLEAIRMVAVGLENIPGEALWSPVGWIAASVLNTFAISEGTLVATYKGLWLFHMANTMAFIACVPYTKFFHIVAAPLNALITPFRRGGVMLPMDFEDETQETFGLR